MHVRALRFLTVVAAAVALAPQVRAQVREQTADQQVRHVLNRLAFGPRPGDYERVRAMGVDAWIEQQLHPERIADPAVTQLLSQLPMYTTSVAKLRAEYGGPAPQAQLARARTRADTMEIRQDNREATRARSETEAARVGRAVISERQLEEVLVDFWLNHFNVFVGKNQQEMRFFLASYEREVIRPRVFGKFRDLLGAVAHSPAMLLYLDNRISGADSNRITLATYGAQQPVRGRAGLPVGRGSGNLLPTRAAQALQQRGARGLNENYARELLELHTLGVDGGYTQKDVIEVARAFTGWSIVPPNADGPGGRGAARQAAMASGSIVEGDFMFRPQVHDAEEKIVLGTKIKAGRGVEDGELVLDIVAKHPSTARYIATKLARRLVSDSPSFALVERAADKFTKTKGDLREVVRVIVTSPEFFAASAYRAKVKSPFEVVVSALRAVGAPADVTPRTHQVLTLLGQPVFGHQTPDGWPETGDEWINTGSILNRINFGIFLAAGRMPGTSEGTWPLPVGIRRESREAQVDAVIAAFLGGEASVETRQILISGTNPMLATAAPDSATNQMATRASNDADVTGMDPVQFRRAQAGRAFQNLPPLEGVAQIVGLALGSPEFQRR
ncbi:MAG TPA: DUF1800 domain-containing protein [Gemmatimonadaceae bacterium]|nr:DUF1800 domain-containing protein [Gemmatimonadaceae bacterium]